MVEACVENGASYVDISGEPQVCDSRNVQLYIEELLKEYLFSMFHVSANVFEHEDKFCLLICNSKMHSLC